MYTVFCIRLCRSMFYAITNWRLNIFKEHKSVWVSVCLSKSIRHICVKNIVAVSDSWINCSFDLNLFNKFIWMICSWHCNIKSATDSLLEINRMSQLSGACALNKTLAFLDGYNIHGLSRTVCDWSAWSHVSHLNKLMLKWNENKKLWIEIKTKKLIIKWMPRFQYSQGLIFRYVSFVRLNAENTSVLYVLVPVKA